MTQHIHRDEGTHSKDGICPAETQSAAIDPFTKIGVLPFINCTGVKTWNGGGIMLPEVREAIREAAQYFVNLDELMVAASHRISRLTGTEFGIVTPGCSAAITLATAACVAGNDPIKMLRLPFTDGWVHRVVMLSDQRSPYDQAIRMVGCPIVEVANLVELKAALNEPVAMIAVLGTHDSKSAISVEELSSYAKPRNIPILVDAASEYLATPNPYIERGADLVVYSGGKYLRGPQTSGLLLGRKELVDAAWKHASPHQAFARGMKVSKEDIIGLLTALDIWFNTRDEKVELRRWNDDLHKIANHLSLAGIETRIISPTGVGFVPKLLISWSRDQFNITGQQLRLLMDAGSPRIIIEDMTATDNSIEIDPFSIQSNEAEIVGKSIARCMSNVPSSIPVTTAPPRFDITGKWRFAVSFLWGEREHIVTLNQTGNQINGRQVSSQFIGDVTGSISGGDFELVFTTRHEGQTICYRFVGALANDTVAGIVILGAHSDYRKGPSILSQFGTARFNADRISIHYCA